MNQKPTDLQLLGDTLPENTPGATVGKLVPIDADNDGFYTYHFSDERFTAENGYLKLREGVKIDYTDGRSIPITTTVTDSGGNRYMKTFYVRVQDNPDWPENRPGQVKVEGQATIGQTLTASVTDPDGIPDPDSAPDHIQYQWYADGSKIAGAQSAEYTVRAADLGKQLTAEARYTDDAGHIEIAESVRSLPVRAAASGKNLKLQAEPELNFDNLERGTDDQDHLSRAGERDTESTVLVTSNTWRQNLYWILGIAGVSAIAGWIIANLHLWLPRLFPDPASLPYLDAASTITAFAAQFLMMRRKIENWYLWIIVDIVAVGLYWYKGVAFVALLYLAFLINACYGLWSWRKSRAATLEKSYQCGV